MNLKNKLLILSITLIQINAGLVLTREQKSFVETCKHFVQSVLKVRVVDKDMLKAFTHRNQMPSYPFELIDNPNTENIQDMSREIDAFCVAGVDVEFLALGGSIYEMFSRLCPEDGEAYLAKAFALYEQVTTNENMKAIGDESVQKLCMILKSQPELTEEEKVNYIDQIKDMSGFINVRQHIGILLGGGPDEESLTYYRDICSSLRKLLSRPLDWEENDDNFIVLLICNVVGLETFGPFVSLIDGSEYDDNLYLGGKNLAIIYACKKLRERNGLEVI